MELLSDEIKREKPENWNMAYKWASHPSQKKYGWRWEFVRRSKIFQHECQAIRKSIGPFLLPESFGSFDPNRLPRFLELFDCLDIIMGPLCRGWGLSIEELFDHQLYLLCDYEADFPTLLTALLASSSFINDINWRASSRLIAKRLSKDNVPKIHPPIKYRYKVSQAQYPPPEGTNIFYRNYLLLEVTPPEGKGISTFLELLKMDIPECCFDVYIENNTALISATLQYHDLPHGIRIPDFSRYNHIKEAVEKAYGELLPTLNPWGNRRKPEFYIKQLLALDVESGIISKEKAGFVKDKNFSRILKNAKSKIEALEKNAKIRREKDRYFSSFSYIGNIGTLTIDDLPDSKPVIKKYTPKSY